MIEAMSEDEVKQLVADHCAPNHAIGYQCRWCRLILAYAHAKAEAERPHGVTKGEQLAVVLARIGWQEGK